jgi:hypothetical protein
MGQYLRACTGALVALCACTFAAQAEPAQSSPAPVVAATPSALPSTAPSATPEPRRALDAPLDPIFPSADFLGPTIGVPNSSYRGALQNFIAGPNPLKSGIEIYGWIDPGVLVASSKHSSYPLTYNNDPNMVNLDQLILRVERQPDTAQTDHFDYGFRLGNLFGMDYRWTTAEGYFSEQLLKSNQLYGYDPVEAYGILYFPKFGQGTVVQVGRYISPPDIEAQLAPNNYLYSHSLFFDFDCYTKTGILASTKLSNYWTLQYGVHAGNDTAPWDPSANFPTGEVMARYVTHANKDSFLFGVDAINAGGRFRSFEAGGNLYGHDNLQQSNFTWTHVFSPTFHNLIETYYLYENDAYVGGTINNGPPRFGSGGGAGAYLPGLSTATGFVDYLEKKFAPKDFASFRVDYMNDGAEGWRSGFPTSYGSLTFGVTDKLSPTETLRPEIRYEKAFRPGITPYDNGTRPMQMSFGMDFIQTF